MKPAMPRWLPLRRSMSLRRRIVVYSIVMLTLNLCLIGAISYLISSATIAGNGKQVNESIVVQTMKNVDFVLRGVEREAIYAFDEIDLYAYLQQAEDGDRVRSNLELIRLLQRFISVTGHVEDAFLVGVDRTVLSVRGSKQNLNFDEEQLIALTRDSGGRFAWTYTELESDSIPRKQIALARAVYDRRGDYAGFFIVLLREDTLGSFFPDIADKLMLLSDPNGTVVSSNDSALIGETADEPFRAAGDGSVVRRVGGERFLIAAVQSDYTHWRLTAASPYSSVWSALLADHAGLMWRTGAMLLLFVVLIVAFAHRLTNPLRRLHRAVEAINQSAAVMNKAQRLLSRTVFPRANRWSFRTRLTFGLIFLILMPVVFLIMISYNFTHSVVQETALQVKRLNAVQIKKQIESYVNNLEKTIYNFYYDPELLQLMAAYRDGGPIRAEADVGAVSRFVDGVINQKRDIAYLDIYNSEMRLLYESKPVNRSFSYAMPEREELARNKLYPVYRDYFNENVITFTRKIAMPDHEELLGYAFFTFREADLEAVYGGANQAGDETVLVDSRYTIMSAQLKNRIGETLRPSYTQWINELHYEGNAVAESEGRPVLISYFHLGNTGWKIVRISSLRHVDETMFRILFYDVLTLLASAAAIVLFVARYSARVSVPVNELTDSVVHFANRLFEEKEDFMKRGDEVDRLTAHFRRMIGRIDTLIKEVYEIRIKKNEAELAMLQAQINPHFLYNTLEVIRWKSEMQMDGENEVSEMVSALSDYFRISLSKGRKSISLEEELEQVGSYLKIMGYRYRDKFDVCVDATEEARSCELPKITLQPMVENALYHGIKGKEGKGVIRISAAVDGNDLLLSVRDDGVGMERETLEALRASLLSDGFSMDAPRDGGGGYGLRNTKQRIMMHFGDGCRFEIDSERNRFTQVTVRMPAWKNRIK